MNDPVEKLHQRERDQERHRLRDLEARDLEVEATRGARPLEGFAGGHTTWSSQQDDRAATEVFGQDEERRTREEPEEEEPWE
ncbi:hypothetical protein [Melittangium boletus]|uniref:Uncharacterized protein n=1 Tax=Melittangium boletus DSM 14713 TaxID=1294270 RepID=A0A250IF86_9BACT|nr:hypothetical protein [Melittangium boletus]ATB30499.1 hypothetical protein MEBOL_003960 [Melittangium boletus DSM 14713]